MNASALSSRERLVFPLDVENFDDAKRWINRLCDHVGVFKVGLQLFTIAGPAAVDAVHQAGAACFLDLKLHDIPNTVAHATVAAVDQGVRYLTLHAGGGAGMLNAAQKVVQGSQTQLLAVTLLTSLAEHELSELGIPGAPQTQVQRLATIAHAQGLRAFVCAAHECTTLRSIVGHDSALVVPGIRETSTTTDDQQRIATPEDALRAGADLLVVGRPIRLAAHPEEVAARIRKQIDACGQR